MPIHPTTQKLRSIEESRANLKLQQIKSKNAFSQKYKHVEKYLKEKGVDPGKIREHSARLIGSGILTGALLFVLPKLAADFPDKYHVSSQKDDNEKESDGEKTVVNTIKSVLPTHPRPLERSEEKFLEQVFKETMKVKSKANLEGEHLNTTYGLIGIEQHLRRYPGDTLDQHETSPQKKEGMAPGLGAWGYFASSKEKLTPELVETEKYYAVVQTLYLPDWNTRQPYLKNWYKYRKVLIVNTVNGKAVVAAIADSGPAAFTGKHFGGSPEVMNHLGGARYTKGKVILFFVDDPENKVKLGPIEY